MARTEKVIMKNMCMVFSENRVLVQDKTDDDYSGITFPGGHVERGESFTDVKERYYKRLARSYNDRIKRIVNDMSQSMNEDCFSQFKIWEEKLLAKINANLTELNPELKSLAEIIRIETENITELENNQTMIQASLDTIKDLMSWKEAEEE